MTTVGGPVGTRQRAFYRNEMNTVEEGNLQAEDDEEGEQFEEINK